MDNKASVIIGKTMSTVSQEEKYKNSLALKHRVNSI